MRQFFFFFRLDTGEDQRISKEEFTDDSVKKTIETVSLPPPCLSFLYIWFSTYPPHQWVGPIDDMEAEFAKIDRCCAQNNCFNHNLLIL